MSSAETPSSGLSSSELSAATPSPSRDELPLITVSPRCIEGIQRSHKYEVRSSYPPPENTRVVNSIPIPYLTFGSCAMDPDLWPATRCPKDYTSAYRRSPNRALASMVYNETLYCCPTAYDFAYREDYTVMPDNFTPTKSLGYTAEYPSFTHQCVISKSFSGPLLVLLVDPTTTSPSASPTPETVTLQSSDIFVASPWIITYEYSSGASCAPACSSPWRSDDPFPIPTPARTSEPSPQDSTWVIPSSEPPQRDRTWDMTPSAWLLFLVLPLTVVLSIAGFVTVCCIYTRKERKKAVQVIELQPQPQQQPQPRYEAPGVKEPPPPYSRS